MKHSLAELVMACHVIGALAGLALVATVPVVFLADARGRLDFVFEVMAPSFGVYFTWSVLCLFFSLGAMQDPVVLRLAAVARWTARRTRHGRE